MAAADEPIADVFAPPRAFVASRPFGGALRRGAQHGPQRAFVLGAELAARLEQHCLLAGDTPNDVVADAIALHLDAAEEVADE